MVQGLDDHMASCSTDAAVLTLFESAQFQGRLLECYLFHDLLSAPMFHHSVWSVITAHKLTPAKRDVITAVSDQRSRFTAPSIGDYNTVDTVAKHRRRKVTK